MFNEDNIFYSNQGGTGTAIRHAIAKAIVSQILWRSGYRINITLSSVIKYLLSHKYHCKGGNHEDFDEAQGFIKAGPNYNGDGNDWEYKCKISVQDI